MGKRSQADVKLDALRARLTEDRRVALLVIESQSERIGIIDKILADIGDMAPSKPKRERNKVPTTPELSLDKAAE